MWQIISNYIGILILCIGEITFAKIVLNQKIEINRIQAILIFLITTILCTIIYIYTLGTLKTILIYIIHMMEFKFLFNLSYIKSMFLSFLYIVVLMIPETLELLIIKNTFINSLLLNHNIIKGIIGNLTVCILFIIVTLILKKPLRNLIKKEISDDTRIITLAIITLIPILLFFYLMGKNVNVSEEVTQYLIAIIVLLIELFSLIKQMIENNKLTEKYDKLLEFMVTYENEIEKQRILRHEVKNEFRTIRAKICDKQKNQEIIEYIDEIVNDKYEMKQEEYAKFGYFPPNGIKGLCYFKVQEAEEKGIKVALNISKRIKESTIYHLTIKQQRDFGKILGVFLDNAIEASLESNEKQIGIEAYIDLEKEFKMIISNTYNNQIDKNKIGKETFSTKGKTRGNGLLLVKHLVNNNKVFEIKTEIQEKLYIQTIRIKKPTQLKK